MAIGYLNGEFLPLEQARVPVLDRGFLFGDGVYEVIPVFGGRLFRLTQHLHRLNASLEAVRIRNPMSESAWAALLGTLVTRNGGGDQSIYLQVTRGVAKRDHVPSEPLTPTVFGMATRVETGRAVIPVSAVVREDLRWQRCDIKSIGLLANVLMRIEAADAGAYEAILIRDGKVTEGASSNVFVVLDGIVRTPPKGHALLAGITRDLILELLGEAGIACQETEVSLRELQQAEEIWLSSSVRELLPVVQLDGCTIGCGVPGPLWRRTSRLYQAYKSHTAL